MQDSLMQQNPTPESPTQVPRALRIPIHSAYTFGTKNKDRKSTRLNSSHW